MTVELRTINQDNFYSICLLEVTDEQAAYVDSNAVSMAQANFMQFAWFRGIYADNKPVGFVLVDADTSMGKFSLWRLMIDKNHQSKGYGRTALELLTESLRDEFAIERLYTSVVDGAHSAEAFYIGFGFTPTGHLVEGREIELCLSIES